MVELYSVMAMTTVDSAADCYLQSDMDGIVRHLTDASKIMTLREVELSLEMGNDEMKKLARLRHSKDPKQVDKKKVRECWELWKADSSRYKGKAEFARDMLQKFDSLKSARVIEDWCREWESSAK
ncbi:hypothetical protein DFR24_0670 [Panacagrimonas perspica]|uniref:Uncharacterized protein n=2 Tax=Panacagrimonas perspica TaxID=381431 RepID=A0A4V3F644_9GAMM|nr:hypothetical protein DFR24_0670 [Panacagrimonas perspica]THD02648.1 hypothetical protein B1810_13980 [Panacagrimonas perspica]